MAGSKYGKYIVTEPKANVVQPPWSPPVAPKPIAYIDNEVIKGAFYMECVWILPESLPAPEVRAEQMGVRPHTHDYDEILGFFGSDVKNQRDLGGEAELWLEDEKHIINRSCLVFIPKGMKHCPLVFTRVDRPIFHFSVGTGKMYF